MKKKVRKLLVITVLSLGVVGVGGKVAFDYAADKAIKKIASEVEADPQIQKLLKDKNIQQKLDEVKANPELQKKLDDVAKEASAKGSSAAQGVTTEAVKDSGNESEAGGNAQGKTNKNSSESHGEKKSGGVHFSSTSEAATYAMKRFSVSEINHYRKFADGGLTPTEKKELKQVVFSRFSPAEIQAFMEVARK